MRVTRVLRSHLGDIDLQQSQGRPASVHLLQRNRANEEGVRESSQQ